MAADMTRVQGILEQAWGLYESGSLTRGGFVDAYVQLSDALGDGPEREGIEALANLAQDDAWITDAEASLAARSSAP